MNTVFPVEFALHAAEGGGSQGSLLQGFTRDVSEGGMCIEFKSFGKEPEAKLEGAGASLDLIINPTFSHAPIHAHARIVWIKKEDAAENGRPGTSKYRIGVSYESIDPVSQKRLIAYARRMRLVPRATAGAALVLLLLLAGLAVHNNALTRENVRLAAELQQGAMKRSEVAGRLVSLSDDRQSLESELAKMRAENERLESALDGTNAEIAKLSEQSTAMSEKFTAQKLSYESELKQSREREGAIRGQLLDIQQNQEKLRESYQELEESGKKSAEMSFEWMAHWLLSHVNLKTGLVASFEGDAALEDAAFTYDQALASQAFLISGELSSAEAILAFYDSRAQSQHGAYYNAYDTIGGSPQETIIHAGPNLWIGIAALQHAHATGDKRFVPMAKRIGDWAVRLQDAEGGLPGGPGISWYSTEHNLDAYAFFGLLERATGDAKYGRARDAVLEWLKKYAYTNKGRSVNRGKGDATIATDTLGWSIASIGPAKLAEIEFDPEGILAFAEQNCEVTVQYRHPNGETLKVSGFDFAKAQHLGRGGIISTEWTAQMAVSYQVMARYFKARGDMDKARRYLEKSNFYLSELQKMIITSPSRTGQGRGCLPYASMDNVDTGHGWRTPKGSSTGSVAATAYGLFAWKGFNPFEANGGDGDAGL